MAEQGDAAQEAEQAAEDGHGLTLARHGLYCFKSLYTYNTIQGLCSNSASYMSRLWGICIYAITSELRPHLYPRPFLGPTAAQEDMG